MTPPRGSQIVGLLRGPGTWRPGEASQHMVWRRIVGVEHTVIESVDLDGEEGSEKVVISARPTRSHRGCCAHCGRRCAGYDQEGAWGARHVGRPLPRTGRPKATPRSPDACRASRGCSAAWSGRGWATNAASTVNMKLPFRVLLGGARCGRVSMGRRARSSIVKIWAETARPMASVVAVGDTGRVAEGTERAVSPDSRLMGLLMSSRRKAISGRKAISAADFARSVHCAEGTLRRYLRGERAVPVEVLRAWERVTGLVPGTLEGGAGTCSVWLADERPPLPEEARLAGDLFVGRKVELERVGHLLRETTTAKRLLVVGGDPGIGKTRLAVAVSQRAYDDGFSVLWGRCDEHLRLPFQPVAEALRPFVPNFAALVAEGADRGPGGDRGENLARQAVFEQVGDLLAHVTAHRPVLLVFDDLQWAADSTMLLLRHLMVTKRRFPMLVVATWNAAEVDPDGPLAAGLAQFIGRDEVTEFVLGGLSDTEIEQLVPAGWGDAHKQTVATRLRSETGGNPLLVRELLRDLAEQDPGADGPAGLARRPTRAGTRAVVARRLARRTPAAREVLRIASVIGTTFEFSVLAEVAAPAAGPNELVGLLDEARTARLIDETDPGHYRFVHDLVRQVISEQLSATRRCLVHRDVADSIGTIHAGRLDRYRPAMAYHLAEAAGLVSYDRAVDATIAAGTQAVDQVDLDGAARYARIGLRQLAVAGIDDPGRRCDLLCLAAHGEEPGERRRAVALQAVEAATAAADPVRLTRATELYGGYVTVGQLDQTVIDLCARCLATLPAEDRANRARVTATMAMNLAWSPESGLGSRPQIEAMCRDAIDQIDNDTDPPTRGRVYDALGVALQGSPDLALREQVAAATAATGRYMGGLWHRALARLARGDRAGFDHDRALAADSKDRWHRALAAEWDALLALADGRWDTVEAHADRALDDYPGDTNFRNVHSGQIFILYWETGRLAGIAPLIQSAAQTSPGIAAWPAVLALTYLETGDREAVTRLLPALSENIDRAAHDFGLTITLALTVEVAARLGDHDTVARAARLLEPYTGQLVVVGSGMHIHGAVDRFLAIAAGLAGHAKRANDLFLAAVHLEEQIHAVPLVNRTKYWHATELNLSASSADRRRARSLLNEVRHNSQQGGQHGLLWQIERARQSGAGPVR